LDKKVSHLSTGVSIAMKKLLIVSCIALVIVAIYVIFNRQNKSFDLLSSMGHKEHYGGLQQTCEDQCFGSQYYDYCMDVCMNNGSTADFTGRAEEYAIPAIGAPIPLEDEDNTDYVSTFAGPYRYDYPGH
jgi:hypothetical protein